MEKTWLPRRPNGVDYQGQRSRSSWKAVVPAALLAALVLAWPSLHPGPRQQTAPILTATQLSEGLRQCAQNEQRPYVDYGLAAARLHARDTTAPRTVFRNATLIDGDGRVRRGVDIEMQDGMIVHVGAAAVRRLPDTVVIVEVAGRYVSPGLVDMHSHVGVRQEPQILMNADVTESTQPVTPWARAVDGFKPSDEALQIVASGGTTTSLVLTGASNLISGEGFVVKHRATLSVAAMALDTTSGGRSSKRQRYLKMACGENTKQTFQDAPGGPVSREGESGYVRFAFEAARDLRQYQDAWCARAAAGGAGGLPAPYPTSLHWQTLVDVLRGDVSVHLHCYQTQDVFAEWDHADEFGFNISALHHITQAHEMLDAIKARGAVLATFSDEGGFKNENYHSSWHMLKKAADAGIPIALTTDHPAKHGQFFAQEVQIGHHFQLAEDLAMASVTSVPARALGLDNRIGWLRPGYDADLVVWDAHPLSLGATPLQVVADGQTLVNASAALWEQSLHRAQVFAPAPPSRSPATANNDKKKTCWPGQKDVILRGITKSYAQPFRTTAQANATAVVRDGVLQCIGTGAACEGVAAVALAQGVPEMHLRAGHILPGLVSATRSHGLSELMGEPSTQDGAQTGGDLARVVTAADGLQFGDRRLAVVHRRGLTTLITAPMSDGFLHGLSTAFRPGAEHRAIVKRSVSLFFSIGHEGKNAAFPSVSAQVDALRRLLTNPNPPNEAYAAAANGSLPVTIRTDNKDVIAQVVALKRAHPVLDLVIHGGGEAHLLADVLAAAAIPVVLAPFRCSRLTWEVRNCLPGPPLTDAAGPDILLDAGVQLGIGIWDHRDRWVVNALWEASWLTRGRMGATAEQRKELAVDLVSTNMRAIYGLPVRDEREFVVYEGDPLEYGASVALIVEEGEVQKCWPDVEEKYVY